MTRKTKLSYVEIQTQLDQFSSAAYTKYDSDSYAFGYLQSMLAGVITNLPKATQNALMEQLRNSQVMQPK